MLRTVYRMPEPRTDCVCDLGLFVDGEPVPGRVVSIPAGDHVTCDMYLERAAKLALARAGTVAVQLGGVRYELEPSLVAMIQQVCAP